jgi:hypothetical protein
VTADHYDALAVLGVGLVLLAAIEMRLRSLFARHEAREEKMHASAVLLAEGASARALDTYRHLEELRIEASALRLDVSNVSELVRVHEARLSDVEMRLLRASLAVPRREP